MLNTEEKKPNKIFISHSSKDLVYVKLLVRLFESIGLGTDNMFCSSVNGYNIAEGKNILDCLKEQFQSYNLRVVFVLSENYYNSPVSLNEMGAAWVLQQQYTTILLPHFDYNSIKGVIDQMKIGIKLDSEKSIVRGHLDDLRETIISEFDLNTCNSRKIWEERRDEFIDKVNSNDIYWQQLKIYKEEGKPKAEWIHPLQSLLEFDPANCEVMYMLGVIYYEMNDIEKAIKYLQMTTKLSNSKDLQEKARNLLLDVGYII